MKKGLLKFMSGTLFNVVMSVVILSLLGVPDAGLWGLACGVVIPMLLGTFLPKGAALEGVYTEVWTGELVKQLRGGMDDTWLNGVSDYSSAVQNEVVHLVDVGGDPDVLINNTTYPIQAQELEDGDIALGLDKFQTKKTTVSDDELFAISYDKMVAWSSDTAMPSPSASSRKPVMRWLRTAIQPRLRSSLLRARRITAARNAPERILSP